MEICFYIAGVRGFFGRMYHRLRQRYVGSCHPRSGMETDPDERPYAAVASAPGSSLRSDTPRSAKGKLQSDSGM